MYIWQYWENRPGHTIPPYIELCHETVRRHCSDDFEIVLVTPETVRGYIPDAGPFEKIKPAGDPTNPASRADYIRVALLAEYGGIWMDSDLIVLKNFAPMKELIKKHGFVGVHETARKKEVPRWVSVWMLMSQPQGKVILEYKRRLDEKISKQITISKWAALGAFMVTPIVREWADESDYLMLEERLMQPIPWWQFKQFFNKELTPDRILTKESMAVVLWNKKFTEEFRQMPREEILRSGTLVARLLRLSLGI